MKNKITMKMMSPIEWSRVANNPAQRDTVSHAAKAIKNHLAIAIDTHRLVQAANVEGVGLVKLDGHTRSYLWDLKKLSPPELIACVIYDVGSISDAIALYKTIDQSGALETAKDKLSGAFYLCGIQPKSGAITQSGLTSALTLIAGKNIDIYEYSKKFKNQIIAIDNENFGKGKFVSGLLAAVIIGYIQRGPSCLEYFRNYNLGLGKKSGNIRDNVEALTEYIKDSRIKKKIGGAQNHADIAATALNGMERHLAGMDRVRGQLKPLDLKSYIEEALRKLG